MRTVDEVLARIEEIRIAYANAGYADQETSQLVYANQYDTLVWVLYPFTNIPTLAMTSDEYKRRIAQNDLKEKKEQIVRLQAEIDEIERRR